MFRQIFILFLFPAMIFPQDITLVGDVDCDGSITSQDASLILQFVTNVVDELPCQENMTGLTPAQLQEMINMIDEQLNINYSGGGGSNYPIMVSSISSEEMSWGNALIYCADLEEDGYSDWVFPNLDQLSYAVGGGCELPDERTGHSLWTRSVSHNNSDEIYYMHESDGGINDAGWTIPFRCRCVRFEQEEISEGSNNSSSSLGSIVGLGSVQPISMIGPMYSYEDFPNFLHTNNNSGTYDVELNFIDALLFCGQLEYDGYDDWFLPSLEQIINYYTQAGSIIINNFSDDFPRNFWVNNRDEAEYHDFVFYIYVSPSNYSINLTSWPNAITMDAGNKLLEYNAFYYTTPRSCFCVR